MDAETQTVIGILLLSCLLFISLPFEKRYTERFFQMGQHPGLQFLFGMFVIWLATEHALLGSLAFLVFFLWIADVQFFSSFRLHTPNN